MAEPDRLLHFGEDPSIDRFVPRVPPTNPGQVPAVWAIDREHAPVSWFPPTVHAEARVELRFVPDLWPFRRAVLASGLPFSGVRAAQRIDGRSSARGLIARASRRMSSPSGQIHAIRGMAAMSRMA